ncbi:MAG: ABC transporter substrate-binding protein [Candidatus Odinarchaeota archaeon]
MKTNVKIISWLFFLTFIFSTFSCSEKKNEITIGYLPIIAHLPAMVAEHEKYFDDVVVNFKVYGSSNDLLNDLINNEINCATTVAFSPLANYYSTLDSTGNTEFPVKIFSYSKTSLKNPFDGVFVNESSGIDSLNDLEYKRIGLFPGTTAKNILSYLLENQYNIEPSTIKWVYLPPSTQIESLRSGDIDALFTYETVRTIAENNNFKKIHGSVIASVLNDAPYGCSAINTNFYKENKEVSKKVINALNKSIAYINDNPESSRIILQESLSLSDEIASSCNLEYRLTSSEINKPENKNKVEEFLSILVKSGELKNDFDIDNALLVE